jgi:hypothetical protein
MDFAQFLKGQRAKKNIPTVKEHYEELGGEKTLKISLRHFQQIGAGKHPPSESLFGVLFSKVPRSERKLLVLAYFESVLSEANISKEVGTFLQSSLMPQVDIETKGLFDGDIRHVMYTEEQLVFLSNNTEALRFHKRLMLFGDVPIADTPLKTPVLSQMRTLDLVQVKEGRIKLNRDVFRLPHFDNSSSRAVSKATEFIFKHLDLYVSREGSESQELSFSIQLIPKSAAPMILEHMKMFKKWVQSFGPQKPGPDTTPFVFVSFGKKMEPKEM